MEIFDKHLREQLKKATKAHFVSAGWNIEQDPSSKSDFHASFRAIKLSLECIDQSVGEFHSRQQIFTKMARTAGQKRRLGRSTIAVFANVFDDGYDYDASLKIGVAAVVENNLSAITDVKKFYVENTSTATPLQVFLIEESSELSVVASDQWKTSHDREQAKQWLQRSLTANPTALLLYTRLCALQMGNNEFKKVQEIANNGMQFHPNDRELMDYAKSAARKLGDTAAVAAWEARFAKRPKIAEGSAAFLMESDLPLPLSLSSKVKQATKQSQAPRTQNRLLNFLFKPKRFEQ